MPLAGEWRQRNDFYFVPAENPVVAFKRAMEKIKVLLVEDDEDDYLITRRLLAEIGSER